MTRDPRPATRLRGHHLMCLQWYRGEGYSPGFVHNLEAVLDRCGKAETLVVHGADDVCAACPDLSEGSCGHAEGMDAEVSRLDDLALELLGLSEGDAVDFGQVREMLGASLPVWREQACGGCEWRVVCARAESQA